jgi:hypothetical protein
MSIGHKGMLFASKSLGLPWLIYLRTITKKDIKEEFLQKKERKFESHVT